jgi:6-phosphogluconolactonase
MQNNSRWHYLETAEQVAEAACQQILNAAESAISNRGKFKLVLAGGTTPEKVYQLLAASGADWANWYIYYGDERCLPADHPDRNSALASGALLNNVAIPESHIFTIPAEIGPELAADRYKIAVAKAGTFDMVLLGVGEDGHTASLFPGHQHPENELTHPVYNSPKPPSERVSISAKALSNAREVIFLVTGANKQEIVKQWRSGENLPVATIVPENPVDIYVDSDAFKPESDD